MAITYGELKKRILIKIDEYEADVEGFTDDEDIIAKMPDAVNEAVRYVFYGKSHNKDWEVEQGSSINALEPADKDDRKLYGEHRTSDIVYEAEDVYAFYFEVDNTATVVIETYGDGEWIENKRIEHSNPQSFSEFKPFKGKLSHDIPVRARITFSGPYYYHFRNVCLHNVAYETDEKIPEYTGFCQHDIPKNLYQIVECYRIVDGERKNVSYYTEDYKLYLPPVKGIIHLVSKFFPDPVDKDTPDDYVIDIPIDNEWIVVAKASAIMTMEGEATEFINDEQQYMQMLEGDRGRSGAPKVVRLR